MVILALGFTGPEESLPNLLNIDMNDRGNISSNSDYQTKKIIFLLQVIVEEVNH